MGLTRVSIQAVFFLLLPALNALRVSADTHYVDLACATPVSPYTNWATAATVIQDAIDVATNGDTVLVSDGVYNNGARVANDATSNRVAVTKAITLQSVNGPNATIIQGIGPSGKGAVRCVYLGTNAVLAGFTMTNGYTQTTGNTATDSGGGVWCEVSAVLSNCILAGNAAGVYGSGYGGGAYRGSLKNCTLSGNSARSGGGASRCALYNCLIKDNYSLYYGGGASYGTLSNCTITANASNDGGGVYAATLKNCTLSGNSASSYGGGIYGQPGMTVNNCTITGNSADHYGGTVLCELNNCIVYYNTARNGPNYSLIDDKLKYCCTMPDPGGEGNITNEPCLVSVERIALTSPCVGKGSMNYASGADIDGELWRSPPSIGVDEPYEPASTGQLSVAIKADVTTCPANYEARFTALIGGRATRSAWDFGDGTWLSNRPYASHAWTSTNSYSVVLTAWNFDHPRGVSCTTTVSVVVQPIYYVNVSNATPQAPYTNWATASTSIQKAISAGSGAGRLILVADGVYELGGAVTVGSTTNRVALTDAMTVRSINGPAATSIKGKRSFASDGVRCAYVGKGCTLAGFTLTNGASQSSSDLQLGAGGGALCEFGGLISNCWIIANSAYMGGGGVFGGTVKNCRVIGNTGGSNAGGAFQCDLTGCTLARNSAGNYGGGAESCALVNCLVYSNSAQNCGGVSGGTLTNCTVSWNRAENTVGGVGFASLNNCIVYFNSAPSFQNIAASVSVTYSCTMPAAQGVGNITNAPIFFDAVGGDYRLCALSPGIDAGINYNWMFTTLDLGGNKRILNGTADMGAYEFAYAAKLMGVLQGPFKTNRHAMTSSVITNLPARPPYAADARTVPSVPSNTVDWVSVEVQDTNRITLASMSVFMDAQGVVRDPTGGTNIPVEVSAGSYYLVLKHRNHLAAVSAQPVAFTNTVVTYDFTTGPDKYFGGTNACVELEPGVWGLIGGDADGDGRITPVDREIVRRQRGMTGYLQGDLNLDGKVDGDD